MHIRILSFAMAAALLFVSAPAVAAPYAAMVIDALLAYLGSNDIQCILV